MSIIWQKRSCLFGVFRTSNCLKIISSIIFLFLFTPTGAQQSQNGGPQNTLSFVGSNVTLKCSTPSGNCSDVVWRISTPNTGTAKVFDDSTGILLPYRDRYGVDNSSGCDLVIKNVQLPDAGRFTCEVVISSKTTERSAYLIVLKTRPNCTINSSRDDTVEGDGLHLTCEVTYNGTIKASMLWKDVYDAPAAVESGKTIRQSYSVVAPVPEVRSFNCVTSFEVNMTEVKDLASNILEATCETPAIQVLYSVRNVTLSPSQNNYSPGTTITCNAKGNPNPSYKWQMQDLGNDVNWSDIRNQNGSEFAVSNVTSKRYKCVAMNAVRGKSYNVTSEEFQVNNTDDNVSVADLPTTDQLGSLPLAVWIAVGVAGGCLLLIVLLAICFCVRSCPGYQCCHSVKKSKEKISEEQPLRESPDIYSNAGQVQQAPKAKPRSAPTTEPPKRPQGAAPQAKPRTDAPKAGQANQYNHEEVTYAELARESVPRHVVVKNHDKPEESVYADVKTA